MRKYQIVETRANDRNAFSKAPRDVSQIAETCGFSPILVSSSEVRSFVGKICDKLHQLKKYVEILLQIKPHSVILVQSPCFSMQTGGGLIVLKLLKKLKGVKLIIVIHDADEFRYGKGSAAQGKCVISPLVRLADRIIVHNDRMRDWYKAIGVDSERLVALEVFDYLTDRKPMGSRLIANPHAVVIASNLDPKACRYLKFLKLYDNLKWELVGPNFSEQDTGSINISYNGCFDSDELPEKLPLGFGLVWYGDSRETCNCYFKEYLKIINPHKTSAYLAGGLPVIVWKDIGIAEFVASKGVGLCVNSLDDIPKELAKLTPEQLEKMQLAVNEISLNLRNGYYTKKAVEICLASIAGKSISNKE